MTEYNWFLIICEIIDNRAMSSFSRISAHYIYHAGEGGMVKLLNTKYQWGNPSTTCNPFRNPCIESTIFEFLRSFTLFCRLQCFRAALCTLFEEESCVFKVASLDCLV